MHVEHRYVLFYMGHCGSHWKKWSQSIKGEVHFSCFMTILSHFCFIIFNLTHMQLWGSREIPLHNINLSNQLCHSLYWISIRTSSESFHTNRSTLLGVCVRPDPLFAQCHYIVWNKGPVTVCHDSRFIWSLRYKFSHGLDAFEYFSSLDQNTNSVVNTCKRGWAENSFLCQL